MGYSGYTDFQNALRQEAQERLFSPIVNYPNDQRPPASDNPVVDAGSVYSDSIRETFLKIEECELAHFVKELADLDRRIVIVGGRFSDVLARYLVYYLTILRPDVHLARPDIHSLVDVTDRVSAVVFDFRRYQASTIEWGNEAAKKGAKVLLMSDQYLSPLASKSFALLAVSNKGLEPFDSLAGAFAVTELIISQVTRALGPLAGERLSEFVRRQDEEDRAAFKSLNI